MTTRRTLRRVNLPLARRMWECGPLRLFAESRTRLTSNYLAYQSQTLQGVAGPYICSSCRQTTPGVYYAGGDAWICHSCYRKASKQAVREAATGVTTTRAASRAP